MFAVPELFGLTKSGPRRSWAEVRLVVLALALAAAAVAASCLRSCLSTSSRSPEVAVAVGGGKEAEKESLPVSRLDAEEVGAGVEDLGPLPDAPAGDLDLLRALDLALFLAEEDEAEFEAGAEDLPRCCCWNAALSAAASAAALSSAVVGTRPD